MGNGVAVYRNIDTELPYNPAIPFLNIYSKVIERISKRRSILTPIFSTALLTPGKE